MGAVKRYVQFDDIVIYASHASVQRLVAVVVLFVLGPAVL